MAEKSTKIQYEFRNVANQYYAVLSANLIMFSHGCTVGWVSPALLLLMSDDSPLKTGPITLEQASWIGSISCIGALFGIFSIGLFTSFMGCKRAMAFLAIPALMYWLTIIFGETSNHIIFARFLAGWTGGGIQTSIILFVADVAEDRIRGRLGSVSQLSRNTGILAAYGMGAWLQYKQVPYVFISIPIVYLINFILLPNTPQYLVKKGKIHDAEKSLKYYKGCKGDTIDEAMAISGELERLQGLARQRASTSKLSLRDVCQRDAMKGILIGMVLTLMNQLTGCYTFLTYAVMIFAKIGTSLNPYISTIILGVVQIAGSLFTTQLADRFGRKTLLNVSLIGSVLGQLALVSFIYLDKLGLDVALFRWVPVASAGFVIFIASMGFVPLHTVCIVEMLSPKIRTLGITVCTISSNIFAFTVTKSFPILSEIIDIDGCVLIMSVSSIFGVVFVVFVMEETKGKNLDTNGSSRKINDESTNTV